MRPPTLNTIDKVRIEQGRIYRAALAGRVDVAVASRLTWMLVQMVSTLLASQVKMRLTALEGGSATLLLVDDSEADDGAA